MTQSWRMTVLMCLQRALVVLILFWLSWFCTLVCFHDFSSFLFLSSWRIKAFFFHDMIFKYEWVKKKNNNLYNIFFLNYMKEDYDLMESIVNHLNAGAIKKNSKSYLWVCEETTFLFILNCMKTKGYFFSLRDGEPLLHNIIVSSHDIQYSSALISCINTVWYVKTVSESEILSHINTNCACRFCLVWQIYY